MLIRRKKGGFKGELVLLTRVKAHYRKLPEVIWSSVIDAEQTETRFWQKNKKSIKR